MSAAIVQRASDQLGSFLPRLGGALVLLVVGFLLARLIGKTVTKALQALGLDDLAERHGVNAVLDRVGAPGSLSEVTGRAIRITLTLVVLFAALSLLGLQFLGDSLNTATLYLPNLLVAAALLLAGVTLAAIARRQADRVSEQMDAPVPLGRVAEIVILAIFLLLAAQQLRLSSDLLVVLLVVLLGAAALTLTLAFGLGGREVARNVSAAHYAHEGLASGRRIAVGVVDGTIEAIEPAAITVRTGPDRVVRVPNHLLLETPVTIFDEDAQG